MNSPRAQAEVGAGPGAARAKSATRAPGGQRLLVDARMLGNSGIGTYVRHLLPRLVASAPPGLEFEFIGGPELGQLGGLDDARVTLTRSTAAPYSAREQIEGALRRRRGDAYWSPHYNIPLLRGGKMLVTVHDLAHLALPEYTRAAHRHAYARLMFARVRTATARIFDSRFSADEFARLVGPVGPGDEVIYPGVEASWFSIERAAVPPYPRPYLLYVGNVKPHKNVRGLLDAFRLMADGVEHDLIIVGRREGFIHGDPEAVRRAEALGGRVVFTDWVDDARLEQYFAHADALVFPSRYEGFGLPPLEAMASGCPVVVSRAASLPEVCGDAAIYCDPSDPADIAAATRRLLGDRALRDEMVERGRERAREFTWDRCAAQTAEMIGRLL